VESRTAESKNTIVREIPDYNSFYFRGPQEKLNLRAQNRDEHLAAEASRIERNRDLDSRSDWWTIRINVATGDLVIAGLLLPAPDERP